MTNQEWNDKRNELYAQLDAAEDRGDIERVYELQDIIEQHDENHYVEIDDETR